jgi:hypothetical protein
MASTRKHGTHAIHLAIPSAAAGSAADTVGAAWTYQSFAGSSSTASGGGGLSGEQEWLLELILTTYLVLTGQATNFVSLRVTHVDSTGTVKNRIRVIFSAAGVVTVANAPINYAVPSAAAVPGAGTGTLTVDTGVALPWPLANGDSIILDRLSNNATGLATPAASATGQVGVKS